MLRAVDDMAAAADRHYDPQYIGWQLCVKHDGLRRGELLRLTLLTASLKTASCVSGIQVPQIKNIAPVVRRSC